MSFGFSHIKRTLLIFLTIILLLLIMFFDFTTGTEVCFTLFYILPVVYIAWKKNRIWSFAFSIFAALLWAFADILTGHDYSNQLIFSWNVFVRLAFFMGTTFFLHKLKDLLTKERENAKLNSDMVSAVSHEFNNLLTGLNLTALLLEEGEGEKVDKERLNLYKMHRYNYTAMSEQIKVFLNKSKLESGNVKLDITKTDIKNVIDSTVNHFLPIAYQKNIKIIRDFPKTHPFVQCDVDLISLAVSNILSNAIKYSPKSKNIKIRLRRINGNFLKISIKDYGIGIEKEDFNKIFDGFYRTQKSIKHATGFGIGLKMTKSIIELHNSQLDVKSGNGEGSEFHFKLPLYMENDFCKLKNPRELNTHSISK